MKTPAKSLSAPGFVTLAAGCNQLINWGISFYMPGTFARAIAQETGWAATEIYFGLTIAMLMMAMLIMALSRPLWRPTDSGHRYADDFSRLPDHGLRP